jgi:CheY-like chemotaxis protein/nitrogen-specific signal transduction histidine kinase
MPRRRLLLHGELLQVLGDALLKENARTRRQMAHAADAKADADAKDEFLAVLSHELRTPLTPILGWTQILRKSHYDPRQVQRGLEVIERNALLEARLVEDLLDLNRITRGKMSLDLEAHDVNHLLRAAVEPFLEAAATKGIALEVAEAGEPLIVRADGDRLQQILRNLLSNAVKFTDIGGHILVTAAKDSDAVIITVKDDGQGIAPEFLPLVFEMFRQQEEGTRRQHVGLGIGLALVRRIVDLHGGRVSIASAGPGRGTEARVWLPLTMGEIEPVDLVPTMPEMSSNLEGLTVLVVEDVEDMREMLRLALEAGGAQVVLAANGVEALERMETSRPDVVFCDLRMPRMDGFEFLRRLRRATRLGQPPVIAISGLASTGDRRRTREAGFEGHVEKPFKEGALLAAVNAVRKPARHSA